ncbi:MAG TPA: V-type ATPase 116kDa subunit family protein [Spirochaetia bacterium]|nr:V-type ATPase 116kDa subunit family protein [Spirochaetia bacterium]
MIEKMMKVTILFHRSIRDPFLQQLQRLGVLHIENFGVKLTEEITSLQGRIDHLSNVRRLLTSAAEEDGREEDASPQASETNGADSPAGGALTASGSDSIRMKPYAGTTDDFLGTIEELKQTITHLEGEEIRVETDLKSASRWGDFDPQKTKELEAHGFRLRLFSAPKSAIPKLTQQAHAYEFCALEPVLEERGIVFFAVFYPTELHPFELDAAEETLPIESLEALMARRSELAAQHSACLNRIRDHVIYLPWLDDTIRTMQNDLSYRLAHESLTNEVDGHALAVTGWVPRKAFQRVNDFLSEQEVVFVFDEPETSDRAPVLLSNNRFARLFEPIMRIFSLPDYRELDTTPFFAPFYTLFFGLCVADMGYGLVLFTAILIALIFFRKSKMRPLFYLGLILSGSVLLSGVFLDDFFGLRLTQVLGSHNFLTHLVLFRGTDDPMLLAIMLGIIQVIFGYFLRLYNEVHSHGPLGALRPTGVIAVLLGIIVLVLHALGPKFAIGPFALGAWDALIPAVTIVGFVLIGGGLLLILLFNSLEKRIYLRPLIGLWELYELASGIPGDILSYLRLFALGLSGGLLAEAIVHISLLVKGSSPLGYIPMVLVLLFGSLLNLAIGLLSAFVHSLRLTFVEFYKAVGFKGGGVEYSPFKIK